MLALLLLTCGLLVGLVLVPLGLPGLWIMLGSVLAYWMAVPDGSVGLITLLVASALVVVAEVLEFTISGRYARKYGGSRRAGWGAMLGGVVAVVGSRVGAFAGAFAGAFVVGLGVGGAAGGEPVQVATGALIGRVVAAATKVAFGVAIVVLVLFAALVGRLNGMG